MVSLETGKELAEPGEAGEIQARAGSLMAGYLPAEATTEAFCDGWYRTGDVGYVDAGGWLQLTDRSKEMIKVRGFQVAPGRGRGRPARPSRPSPTARCSGSPTGPTARRSSRPSGPSPTGAVDPVDLIALVGGALASYKQPSRVVLVDEIPRLPSGKVLRRVLKERYGRPSDG